MLQIVGALILLIAGFAILRLLFRALISTASALAGLILLCLFGRPYWLAISSNA